MNVTHQERITKYASKLFISVDQLFTSKVQVETHFIGIQCGLLAAAPLQKFGTESLEELFSASDAKEDVLDTSIQLTQDDTTTKSVQVFTYNSIKHNNTTVMTLRSHLHLLNHLPY